MNTKYPVVYLKRENIVLSLRELADAAKADVKAALRETGAEKVNVIAWSRAGLAARIVAWEMPNKIASVTTVCTPHRGLRTPEKAMGKPAIKCWARMLGRGPYFRLAVKTLSPDYMRVFNEMYPNAEGVFYQSCACAMTPADDEKLASANSIISIFDGENDGVVSVYSALWGQRGIVRRGVSHLQAGREIYDELIDSLAENGL